MHLALFGWLALLAAPEPPTAPAPPLPEVVVLAKGETRRFLLAGLSRIAVSGGGCADLKPVGKGIVEVAWLTSGADNEQMWLTGGKRRSVMICCETAPTEALSALKQEVTARLAGMDVAACISEPTLWLLGLTRTPEEAARIQALAALHPEIRITQVMGPDKAPLKAKKAP